MTHSPMDKAIDTMFDPKVDGSLFATVPRHLVEDVIRIRADFEDFDGDRRGILEALIEAEKALLDAAIEDIT